MRKPTHKTWGFLAMVAMFLGWGMVMGGGAAGNQFILYSGGTMLGIGAIYLLYRLYIMIKSREKHEHSNE
ncbi:MAG: hypothetical protein K9H84_00455 [Bacteroidales bacterium]|nr:hypothetical protein [Bacteroidales bacterium]